MWPGFNSNRNLIAHTLRDRAGQYAYLDPDHEKRYMTPNGGMQWLFIRDCMIGIKNILNGEFKPELEQAVKEIATKIDYKAKEPEVVSGNDFVKTFAMIANQSAKIARDHGKIYNLNIPDFYDNNKPAVHFGMMDSY